ncbi:MAG: IS1595 family transposase [Planctomycetes bacterium]|nr:IS1595 family transposase [Planctomycetota bacterium]MCB9909429.1 IS1595 family transposase [Planctomycetota bacterium]HRV81336.1 IS1595 family transposase [Planctomycetota bacterium]
MSKQDKAPETLLEAVTYFADADVAFEFVKSLRWSDGPICPGCDSDSVAQLSTRKTFKCRSCKKQFSIKVGTIFEDSPISLSKWLPAMWLIVNCKNGVSSYELARAIKVTQKTAWFMLHRIRLAMQSDDFMMSGEVEVDETFIGGLARNMHADKRRAKIKGTGGMGKTAVLGVLERHGKGGSKVRAGVIANRKRKTLHGKIRKTVEPGSEVHTDALASYSGLAPDYTHHVIDHAEEYVRGNVHTNGIENFWSLLKRGLKGTYVSVEPFHLFRYIDEQAFRFNFRKLDDGGRFLAACSRIIGRRLTYQQLIGETV